MESFEKFILENLINTPIVPFYIRIIISLIITYICYFTLVIINKKVWFSHLFSLFVISPFLYVCIASYFIDIPSFYSFFITYIIGVISFLLPQVMMFFIFERKCRNYIIKKMKFPSITNKGLRRLNLALGIIFCIILLFTFDRWDFRHHKLMITLQMAIIFFIPYVITLIIQWIVSGFSQDSNIPPKRTNNKKHKKSR